MDLKKKLEDNIYSIIEKEARSQIGTLSGSNALLYDEYGFDAESSDHCPRIALLRRVANVQAPKQVQGYLSNQHGRLFEDLLKTILSEDPDLQFQAEEEVEVILEDDVGNKLLTARPDAIFRYEGILYALEVKTIQSATTAYSVCIKQKPKLGAVIQLAIYLLGHELKTGFLLYAVTNWHSGFAGKTRWKVTPKLEVFECTYEHGDVYVNGVPTIVSKSKLIQGSYEFIRCRDKNTLPNRPHWVDVWGDPATYDGCGFCEFKNVCDKFDEEHNTNLDEFFNECKKEVHDVK